MKGMWEARVTCGGESIRVGTFNREEEAALAYNYAGAMLVAAGATDVDFQANPLPAPSAELKSLVLYEVCNGTVRVVHCGT